MALLQKLTVKAEFPTHVNWTQTTGPTWHKTSKTREKSGVPNFCLNYILHWYLCIYQALQCSAEEDGRLWWSSLGSELAGMLVVCNTQFPHCLNCLPVFDSRMVFTRPMSLSLRRFPLYQPPQVDSQVGFTWLIIFHSWMVFTLPMFHAVTTVGFTQPMFGSTTED